MLTTAVVDVDDPLRSAAERLIRETYAARYSARLDAFPSRLLTVLDARGEILCAAGLRFPADGFFSERYLDVPIEDALGALSQRPVGRGEIFEVTTLASRAPRATADFIAMIVSFGERNGFNWSFFTLTRRLHLMVARLGLALTQLADADHRRIEGYERWGSYYAAEPKVYAVNRRWAREGSVSRHVGRCHADAV